MLDTTLCVQGGDIDFKQTLCPHPARGWLSGSSSPALTLSLMFTLTARLCFVIPRFVISLMMVSINVNILKNVHNFFNLPDTSPILLGL